MGKPSLKRQLSDTEARAVGNRIRVSPQKLNLVAGLIRGKSAEAALTELTFSKRGIAPEVRKVLQSAIANAENNHQLDVDRLYVSEAHVGKSLVMKRMWPRGRGRSSPILKPFSNITIVVREREEQE